MSDVLTITTLGYFMVRLGDTIISSDSARSQKVWKVFKRLITSRHKMVTVESLIETLWPEDEPLDPQKSLYTLISRLRKILTPDGVERHYILYQHNSYQWNPQIPIVLDVAIFEQLLKNAEGVRSDEEKLPLLKQAVELYTGDYLPESTSEIWALSMSNFYKRLYLRAVTDLSDIYSRQGNLDDMIRLCSSAISNEPYEESIHERLIQALFINGEIAAAQQHYNRYTDLILREFGAEPSEEFRTLFRGIWDQDAESYDLTAIKAKLDSDLGRNGAYFCTSDIFNQFYLFDKRADERMKFPVFLALITVTSERKFSNDSSAEIKFLKSVMITLRQCLMRTLRRGDVVSQYSKNQFLLMLSAYLPQDAETALSRVNRMFTTEYKGEPAAIDFSLSQIGNESVSLPRPGFKDN